MNQVTIDSRKRIKSDLLLLLASVIWGSGFIAQEIAADSMGSFLFNGGRFLLGMIILLFITRFHPKIQKGQLRWVFAAGVLLFGASALQQIGLETTSVGNAAFITSLYVVFIPIILWIFGLQKIKPVLWIAVAIAVIGTLLLSTGGSYKPARGDWFELACAVVWAGQILVIGIFGKRSDPLSFTLGEFAVAAGLNLICTGLFESAKPPPQTEDWWAMLFSGIFPVTIAFSLQVIGQRHAPPIDASLIFSLEAVFAAIFGYWLLSEKLAPIQIMGCVLILAALLLAQSVSFRRKSENLPLATAPFAEDNPD